jgi:hypothetical protein
VPGPTLEGSAIKRLIWQNSCCTRIVLCVSVRLVSIIGVRNFEGILGADTLSKPGLTAAALNLGERLWLWGAIEGPDTFFVRSKSDYLCSYYPGPTGEPAPT